VILISRTDRLYLYLSLSLSIEMKRPASSRSNPNSGEDTKPDIDELSSSPSPPVSTPKSKKAKTDTTPSKAKQSLEPGSATKLKFDLTGEQMLWDADGKEALMDYLIGQGIKGVDKAVLAEKVGSREIHKRIVELMLSLVSRSRRSIMSSVWAERGI
jgi:hypothetical protein